MAWAASSTTRATSWPSSAPKPARTSTWRWRLIPRCTRRPAPPEADLKAYATKVRAGAHSAITQYFYSADAYFRFVEEARALGADIPVVPGIMPITSSTQLMRFSDACGAEIPRWIRLRLQAYGDDTASIKSFGLDVVTSLCEQLLRGGCRACTSIR